jgi:hypothetical protein
MKYTINIHHWMLNGTENKTVKFVSPKIINIQLPYICLLNMYFLCLTMVHEKDQNV